MTVESPYAFMQLQTIHAGTFTAPNLNLLSVGGESMVSSAVENTLVALGRVQLGSESVCSGGRAGISFPAVFMAVAPSAAVPTAAPSSSVHSSPKSGTSDGCRQNSELSTRDHYVTSL